MDPGDGAESGPRVPDQLLQMGALTPEPDERLRKGRLGEMWE